MAFDWLDYLEIAKDDLNKAKRSGREEALLRSAISRAYYSAFILSRNYLRDKVKDPNVPNNPDAHYYVRTAFANLSNPVHKAIARNLGILRNARNKADYDDNFNDVLVKAPLAVALAQAIINDLSQI
jgi:uncharacterized protein (UPF0332 family)